MPNATRQKYGKPASNLLELCGLVHSTCSGTYQPLDMSELPEAVEILTHARDNWEPGFPWSEAWDSALLALIKATLVYHDERSPWHHD